MHKLVTTIKLNSTMANLAEKGLVDEGFYFKTPDELRNVKCSRNTD